MQFRPNLYHSSKQDLHGCNHDKVPPPFGFHSHRSRPARVSGPRWLCAAGQNRDRITITAQSGSEVVLTKNVHGDSPSERTPLPTFPEPRHDDVAAVAPDTVRTLPGAPDSDATPLPVQGTAVAPLGDVRIEPWRVHQGETLFEAVSRFANRAGRTAQKSERYPIWEVTAEASFSGDFEAALEWLMGGFEHTVRAPS